MAGDETVQRRITAFWDEVGPGYDSPGNVAAPGSDEYAAWREVIRSLLPEQPSDVLDVGTGTGFAAALAAELGHRVTGLDLSEGMLASARRRLPRAGLAVSLVVGDAVAPPFPDRSFDVVISRCVLWTLREPAAAFANWCTLLRPGGRVVTIYGLADRPPAEPPSAPLAEPTGLFPRTYDADTRSALPAMTLSDHGLLVRMAEEAGFADVTVTPLPLVRGWETSPGSELPYALVGRVR